MGKLMAPKHSISVIENATPADMPVPSVEFGLAFVPPDVIGAMERIFDAGFDVWLVGGALRDILLNVGPKDWDLATSAGPEQIMKIFPRVIPVGIRHGTVQVHTKARDIEVTSFEPGGMEGILKDLGRRDFTINALALSFPDGILIDPHEGRADIRKKIIRAVGDAAIPICRRSPADRPGRPSFKHLRLRGRIRPHSMRCAARRRISRGYQVSGFAMN